MNSWTRVPCTHSDRDDDRSYLRSGRLLSWFSRAVEADELRRDSTSMWEAARALAREVVEDGDRRTARLADAILR